MVDKWDHPPTSHDVDRWTAALSDVLPEGSARRIAGAWTCVAGLFADGRGRATVSIPELAELWTVDWARVGYALDLLVTMSLAERIVVPGEPASERTLLLHHPDDVLPSLLRVGR